MLGSCMISVSVVEHKGKIQFWEYKRLYSSIGYHVFVIRRVQDRVLCVPESKGPGLCVVP